MKERHTSAGSWCRCRDTSQHRPSYARLCSHIQHHVVGCFYKPNSAALYFIFVTFLHPGVTGWCDYRGTFLKYQKTLLLPCCLQCSNVNVFSENTETNLISPCECSTNGFHVRNAHTKNSPKSETIFIFTNLLKMLYYECFFFS